MVNIVYGGYVQDHDIDVVGQTLSGDDAAGDGLNHDFFRSLRVTNGHHPNFDPILGAATLDFSLKGSSSLGLVCLNANNGFGDVHILKNCQDSGNNVTRLLNQLALI